MVQTFEIAPEPVDGFEFRSDPKSKLSLRDEALVFIFNAHGYPVEFDEFDGIDEHLVDLSWTWEATRESITSWASHYSIDSGQFEVQIYAGTALLQVGFTLKSEQLVFIKSLREWVFSKPAPKRKKKPDAN